MADDPSPDQQLPASLSVTEHLLCRCKSILMLSSSTNVNDSDNIII